MVLPKKWVSLGVLVAAALALSVAATAVTVDEETTNLKGTGTVGLLTCHAVVDLAGGVYTYSYEVGYATGTSNVHIYEVQNPNHVSFFGAANVPLGEPGEFTNPAPGTDGFVNWIEGELAVGESRTFSYKSLYRPQEIDVYCLAYDGGDSARGKTIGMSAFIPEPASVLAISIGILGLIPMVRRRW